MTLNKIDPLRDPRWTEFVERHPNSSVFHTRAWLEALRRTYGYEPVAFTESTTRETLTNAIVFCSVKSWLTGSRIVSLPFCDHCQPLVNDPSELAALVSELEEDLEREGWKYIEFRPLCSDEENLVKQTRFARSETFVFHKLDLRPDLDKLFHSFHKTAVRQMIQRAEREGLHCEEGHSEAILKNFYDLLLLTRRRHQLPPQPLDWFRNLVDCLGGSLSIHLASVSGRPIASILVLRWKKTVYYKYGCSDARFNNLGATPLLFWKLIEEAKAEGMEELDFGRSDLDNEGLIKFKDRWGTVRSPLVYWRYPADQQRGWASGWKMKMAKAVFGRLPAPLLSAAGRMLYRHMG
jgi:lipid II:glycine glycyltransferase (peptidoglycan interpeptide bridge formation enzyme)